MITPEPSWPILSTSAGSLIGTWLFVLLSVFYQPPLTWFAILAVLIFIFLRKTGPNRRLNLALLACIVVFSWFAGQVPGSLRVTWSPYQKLVVSKNDPKNGQPGDYLVTVNNIAYQTMLDPTENSTNRSGYISPRDERSEPVTTFPCYCIPIRRVF